MLRPRGTLVVYGTGPQVQFPGSFCLVNNITVKFMLVYELTAEERARAVADITRMLEANTLIHNVAETFRWPRSSRRMRRWRGQGRRQCDDDVS